MPVSIALFWDFTQLHENLLRSLNGGGQHPLPITQPQPEVVDIAGLLTYTDQLGRVVMSQAYSDWRLMDKYAGVFSEAAVSLRQIFPNRYGQLEVDRELVADVTTYLNQADSAEEIVVIGGGSEYRQLRQTVKARGRRLTGIGLRSLTDPFWTEACDSFHYYEDLPCKQFFEVGQAPGILDIEKARKLLVESIRELRRYHGSEWVQQVRIKPAIIRKDPNFDERILGYEAFSHFLRDQGDLLGRRHREGEQEPEYRLLNEQQETASDDGQHRPEQLAAYYLRVAGQQGIRMPDPVIMWEGIDVYASFLADEISFTSFSDIDQECLNLLREDFPQLSMTEVKKVRQVLFKCFLFRPSVDETIGFHEDIRELADIEDRYFGLMLSRIVDNLDEEVDYAALSLALTGGTDQGERLRALYRRREEE